MLAGWTGTASGAGSSQASRMPAGNRPAAALGSDGKTVTISWTASTFGTGLEVGHYLVNRLAAGAKPLQVCDVAAPNTECTDAPAAGSSVRYTVTPALQVWRGAESQPSSPVSVPAPALVVAATPTPTPTPTPAPTPTPTPASGARTAP